MLVPVLNNKYRNINLIYFSFNHQTQPEELLNRRKQRKNK